MKPDPFELHYTHAKVGDQWVKFDNPHRSGKKCLLNFKKDHVTIDLAFETDLGGAEFTLELDECGKIQVRCT